MRRELVAVNTAPESENRMHGDEAKRYGFEGGLVPGVDVLGYLAHDGAATWGAAWLRGGRLNGRLAAPVYDGETVVVEATERDRSLESEVRGLDGTVRAVAHLALVDDGPGGARESLAARVDPSAYAARPQPESDERPAAAADLLEPGTVLVTQQATFHADRAQRYLDEISEDHPVFRTEGCAHPGWLLRFANWALSRSVRLGPWINVASDAWLLAPVRDGDVLEVRARVQDRFARKGHEFVDLAALYLVGDRPVALVDHRAIWQPRASDTPVEPAAPTAGAAGSTGADERTRR